MHREKKRNGWEEVVKKIVYVTFSRHISYFSFRPDKGRSK